MSNLSKKAYLKRVHSALIAMLSKQAKWVILSLPAIALISAVFEVATLGMLIPFIKSLTSPEMLTSNEYILKYSGLLSISKDDIIFYVRVIFITFIITSGLGRILCNRALLFANALIGTELANIGVATVLSKSYESHTQSNASEIIVALTRKIDEFLDLTITPVLNFVTSSITLLTIIGFLAWSSPMLSFLILIIISMTYFCIGIFTNNMLKKYSTTQASSSVSVMIGLKELLQGFRDIKLKNMEEHYIHSHWNSDNLFRRSQANIRFYSQSPKYVVETIILLLAVAVSTFMNGQASIIEQSTVLIIFALGLQKALPYGQNIYHASSLIEGGKKSGLDILDLLESEERIKFFELESVENRFDFEKMEFLDVSFKYQINEKYSFQNICLQIERGDRICIMGSSGSGKSTFVDLMMGLIFPTQGKILLNSFDFRGQNLREFQNSIAHVSQDLFLVNSSLAENIAFGENRSDIDTDKIYSVLKQVALDDYLETLPNGVWTQIGEFGVALSGGQRQRLCVARCLYQERAKILILDEPTSALNVELGKEILDLVFAIEKFQAILVVTHNSDIQKYCNRLINFDSENPFDFTEKKYD